MLVITVAPSFEPTVARKIWIMGNPVAFLKIVARFGTLNNTAKSMPRARQPLMARLSSIEQATSVLAFFTSSDIFKSQAYAAENEEHLHAQANLFPRKPKRCLASQ